MDARAKHKVFFTWQLVTISLCELFLCGKAFEFLLVKYITTQIHKMSHSLICRAGKSDTQNETWFDILCRLIKTPA